MINKIRVQIEVSLPESDEQLIRNTGRELVRLLVLLRRELRPNKEGIVCEEIFVRVESATFMRWRRLVERLVIHRSALLRVFGVDATTPAITLQLVDAFIERLVGVHVPLDVMTWEDRLKN